MGIPAFYKWLMDRYPRTVVDAVEEAAGYGGSPIDTTRPNPNGLEFDNLYLDMNGIIHPCFHPEGLPAPKTYDEVFKAVFKYIDKIFSVVRPRKLLFLAIDGVAPRAKMNQQRSRRFKAAKDAADEAVQKQMTGNVCELKEEKFPSLEQSNKLDSNVITPGTEFMSLLSSALRYYINLRMNEDLGWRGLKVILSDASVPGEGEHKVMSYIRLQRNLPGFDPNMSHCLYGLDADLIMLALATHDIHFSILREDVQLRRKNSNRSSKFARHSSLMDQGQVSRFLEQMEPVSENLEAYISRQRFQFLKIWVLREYLVLDMKTTEPKLEGDSERFIDDFVFMCLLVGNDFLPHIPSLEISEGAIDLLMMTYKREFQRMGGYLTNSFEVNLERVQIFIEAVGQYECGIFNKRMQLQKQGELRYQCASKNKVVSNYSTTLKKARVDQDLTNVSILQDSNFNCTSSACGGLDTVIDKPSAMEIQAPLNSACRGLDTVVDNIKFGEEGWKERYYAEKFEVKTKSDFEKMLKHLVLKYIEGICWVMRYYYEGVCSWQWFYPYHYAPLATDFCDIGILKIQFTLGEPFKPFDQLMAVLPAASAHALPSCYRKLMTDKFSPLLDFYPTDFDLDMNGKRFSWQAVCKLPFIEESRLLAEIARVEHTLTDEERLRNNLGLDILFVHMSHPLAVKIVSFSREHTSPLEFPKSEVKQEIDPKFSGGMNGYMVISDKPVQPAQIYSPIEGMEIISNNEVLSIFYKNPPFHAHIPRPPEGVYVPGKSIGKQDTLPPLILWHQKTTVVGRLHFKRIPIPNSICGPPLAKWAHELVSKYYPAKPLNTLVSKRQIGQISADGITSYTNSQTVCVDGRTKNRKRRRKQCSSDAIILADSHVGVKDAISNLYLGEKVALSDNGGDKSCSNERSSKQGNCILDNNRGAEQLSCGLKSSVDGRLVDAEGENVVAESQKRRRKRKRSKGNGMPGNHIARDGMECLSDNAGDKSCSNERSSSQGNCILDNNRGAEQLSCGLKSSVDGRLVDAEGENVVAESQKRRRKRKRSKGNGMPGNHIGREGIECLNSGEAISLVGTESNGNCTNGIKILDSHMADDGCKQTEGIGIPDDHARVGGLACDSNLEKGICSGGAEGEKVVESRKKKRRRKRNKGNGVPETIVGGDGLACSSMREAISAVGTKSNGDWIDGYRILDNHVTGDGQKKTEGTGIPETIVGGDGLACSSMREAISAVGTKSNGDCIDGYRILDNHVTGDGQKKTEGIGIPDGHVGANGLACASKLEEKTCLAGAEGKKVVESRKKKRRRKRNKGNGIPDNSVGGDGSACSNMREEIILVGHESNGDKIHGNRVLDNHVSEDEKKHTLRTGPLDDNEGGGGLACDSNLEKRICIAGNEGEKKVVESQKKKRRKRRKGNGIPEINVGGDGLACSSMREAISVVGTENNRDCIDGCRILDNHVTGDGQTKTEGIGIPDGHVGANGLACDSKLEEKICLAGAEGEKVVESQEKERRWIRNKGNGIPDNSVGGDGSACSNMREEISVVGHESNGDKRHGNRVLDNHVSEDEKKQTLKQTLRTGPLDDNEGGGGLACDSNLEGTICLAGNEGEKKVVESQKKKRRKRRKGNGIPEINVGGDGLACSSMREAISVVGTESNRDCIDGCRILDNHVTGDGQTKTEGIGIPDGHVGANGFACDSKLEEKICLAGAEGEKVVESQEKKRRWKLNKGNGIPDNSVGGDGSACSNMREEISVVGHESHGDKRHGNRVLDNHVSEDEKKQTLGTGPLDDNEGGGGLACDSNLEGRICVAGNEGKKKVVESHKKKRRKRRKGNGIPEINVGGDGLACSSMREAISVVGTESNRDCIDGCRILDNHVTGDGQTKTEGIGIPDGHVGANGLACDSKLEEKICLAGAEGEKVVESQEKKRRWKLNKGNGIPDNSVGGDGSACSNMREEISVVGHESHGDKRHGNRVLDNHVSEDEKKQTLGTGPLDANEGGGGLACNSNLEERICLAGNEGEKKVVESQKKEKKET
ncbi:uncharacterized protein LOC107414997 isoform X1 [Ziziphus jujuba]|uniref:Uncharacterized protein LOC107414997 isoform X1 n=1 Tax=Ziziphus jujuba TaxID=326968 RepID=A0A6P3ZTD4_ZIZJJ|nr:uncharacterized protein LOC107414997 isoform X1 [Ziziphus jujuba]